jgi:hypothetical protein
MDARRSDLRRTTTIRAISGAILALAFGTACEPTPPPGKPAIVVEGPIWSFDTVVVRGAGCDPAHPAGPRVQIWPAGTNNIIELRAMGSAASAVRPDGTVAVTFQTPLLAPGAYYANLICTGSLTNVPTTPVNVIGGAAPQARVSATSPARSGGGATLTAWGCGRSANGEVQASISVLGPSSSFSFYGSTRPDGTVVQGFGIPASAGRGTYTVRVNCGFNPSQIATTHIQVV